MRDLKNSPSYRWEIEFIWNIKYAIFWRPTIFEKNCKIVKVYAYLFDIIFS